MMVSIIIIFLVCVVVAIITEKMTIRRLNVENGVVVSKGRCVLKPGYGPMAPTPATPTTPVPDNQGNLYAGV